MKSELKEQFGDDFKNESSPEKERRLEAYQTMKKQLMTEDSKVKEDDKQRKLKDLNKKIELLDQEKKRR